MSQVSSCCPDCRSPLPAPGAGDAPARCPGCGRPLAPAEPGWFYARDRRKVGPVSPAELRRLARAGELGPADMVLREGARQWVLLGNLPDVLAAVVTIAPAPAPVARPDDSPLAETRAPAGQQTVPAAGQGPAPAAPEVSLERLIGRFEEAMLRGERPRLEDFLPVTEPARRAVLPELVHADLELHLKAGDGVRVEDYLRRFPELAQDRGAVLELLAAEYALLRRREPGLAAGEYGERFPDYRQELLARLRDDPLTLTFSHRPGAAPAAEEVPLPVVPGYEILGELGRGGMGVVYRAWQVKARRVVALKMILTGPHAGPEQLARFQAEAQAAARLQHPHIVQIFEVGEHAGLPFFSLEFVGGGTLAQKLAHTPQPPAEAARLIQTLARAVHAAHRAGVVHRDLKPSNILLQKDSTTDGTDTTDRDRNKDLLSVLSVLSVVGLVPKIADFGLAKQLDDESGRTHEGAVMGTPAYMAPEQAAGRTRDLGPAADVWALGAILYECLTGRPPFRGASAVDTLDLVRNAEPVPPSRLAPKLPRDLETVCLKCLQKEPHKRYGSALELAEDLGRFLADEPIRARPVGRSERLVKWAKRRPGVAALLALVLALGLGGLAAVLWQWQQTEAAREQADDNARAYRTASEQARANEQTARTEAARAREAASNERTARRHADHHLYVAHMNLVQRFWERADLAPARDLLKRHLPRPGEPDNRGFEWFYYWRLLHGAQHTLPDLPGAVRAVAFAPKAATLAIACERDCVDGAVLLWDAARRGPPVVLSKEPQPVVALAWHPDGNLLALATAKAGEPGLVKLWDVAARQQRLVLKGHKHPVMALAFSPDGKTLASGSAELKSVNLGNALDRHQLDFLGMQGKPNRSRAGEFKLWDVENGQERDGASTKEALLSIAFSGDGRLLFFGSAESTLAAYDLGTRKMAGTWHGGTGPLWAMAVPRRTPDDGLLAGSVVTGSGWGGRQGEARIHSWQREQPSLSGMLFHRAAVLGCAYSPDGKILATASLDRTVRLWDRLTREPLGILQGHTDAAHAVAFTPDGKMLATGSWDRSVKLWDLRASRDWLTVDTNPQYKYISVGFFSDGRSLLTRSSGVAKLWDARSLEVTATFAGGQFWPSAGGRLCGGKKENGKVTVWDARKGPKEPLFTVRTGTVHSWEVSPDLRYLVTEKRQGGKVRLQLWDTATGRERPTPGLNAAGPKGYPPAYVRDMSFTPDGRLLAVSDFYGHLKLWDVAAGRARAVLQLSHGSPTLAFAPDGKRLATGGDDGVVRLWDATDLRELAAFKGSHHTSIFAVAFSPDGRMLASGDRDGHIALWDLDTGQERLSLQGPQHQIGSLSFSPDGRALAVGYQGRVALFRGARDDELDNP